MYEVDKLMNETRRLAARYYETTGKVLPVSHELAKYDACRLLNFIAAKETHAGVDAYRPDECPVQIKGRVILRTDNHGYRIGQINDKGDWQALVLVLMAADYQPFEIYSVSRDVLEATLLESKSSKRQSRGIISVAKFKAIADLVWS